MEIINKFERFIVITIISLMILTILISTVELAVIIYKEFMATPKYLLDIKNLLEIFGFFFMILIGLELLHTIKTYLSENIVHVEVVILVAMIAVGRKFILLEYKAIDPLVLFGLSTVIITLAVSYYLLKRASNFTNKTE